MLDQWTFLNLLPTLPTMHEDKGQYLVYTYGASESNVWYSIIFFVAVSSFAVSFALYIQQNELHRQFIQERH